MIEEITTTKLKNDIGRFLNTLEVATQNEQPITISMPLEVFKSALDYSVSMRVEALMAAEEERKRENDQGDLVKPKDTKAMLGISDATLWRYAKSGLLPKKNIGGKVYYSRKDITKLMQGEE